MKICRYNDQRLGVVKGESVFDVSEALDALRPASYPFPRHDVLIENLPSMRARLEELSARASPIAVGSVRLLSPVANPGKIVAAPVNYTRHLEEVLAQKQLHHGNLINEIHKAGLFLKATSSLVGASSPVTLVHTDRRNDHEVELAVVIGQRCRNLHREQALKHVAGYAIGLDITIRGPEERSLRKSPDSYT
ncbi:MAG: FAA hydrolase family protein, partial [Rubrivivax sp.]